MIVKSSFSGKADRGAGTLSYISREGALEGGRASVYDREGMLVQRDDFGELGRAIKDAEMERRLIFSPENPATTNDDLSIMVRDVMERYQTEESKNFDYVYAIHDHNERNHVHVLAWGDKDDLRMDEEDLASIRGKASELEIEHEKTLDSEIVKDQAFEQEKSGTYEKDDFGDSTEIQL